MKLYTEEEIMNYLINHRSTITRYDLQNIPHIQLPSDEEIEQIVQEVPFKSARIGFRKGAKMVIDKILKNTI
jgi:hypothetical protein